MSASSLAPLIANFPHLLHGADYNPEQWLEQPEVLAEDRRLRKLCGCNTFSVGIFSWARLEPREGVYEFAWLDRVLDDLAADGCRAILATPTAARPPWMVARYPEVMRVNRAGVRERFNKRHNFCWSSPVFRARAEEIITRLAERYAGHPALALWHLSNELGGHEEQGECFCPLCLARWQVWLQERYQTLDRLNAAWWSDFWGHRYSAWEEIEPRDATLDACALDWSRFVNSQIREWIEWESAVVRRCSREVPITTNFMGPQPWIDYAELAQAVEVVADDQYPGLHLGRDSLEDGFLACAFKHDWMRNFRPGRAFMLMESCPETPQWQRPQALKPEFLHRAEMLQAIGHGAEGTCYFQWRKGRGGLEKLHGAVVDHSGSEQTRTFGIVQRLSESYARLGPVLGSARPAEIALLYDHDSCRALALTDGAPHGGTEYLLACQEFYRPFWRRGLAVDIVDSRRPEWERARLVLAPHLFLLHPGVAERLAAYVRRGGTVVTTCLAGWVDENNKCLTGGWPGEGLREVFGVWLEELDALPSGWHLGIESGKLPGFRADGSCARVAGRVHAQGAEILARFSPGELLCCGEPAWLRNRCGAGTSHYLAGEFDRAWLEDFAAVLCQELGLASPWGAGDLPAEVVFAERCCGAERFWFCCNIGAQPQSLPYPEAWTIALLAGKADLTKPGKILLPPRGDAVLALRPAS